MIAPTTRAVVLTMMGAPIALVIGTLAPELWLTGAVWAAAMISIVLVDATIAPSGGKLRVTSDAPKSAAIGAGDIPIALTMDFGGRAPRAVEVDLETNALLTARMTMRPHPAGERAAAARFALSPTRRGQGILQRAFVRWRGPLGLAWREQVEPMAQKITLTPDLGAVEREAGKLFSRTSSHGVKPLRDRGDGSEFDALAEFEAGMDRRLIDWKQTARHNKLLAKEVRAERNHQIVFAIDTGRLMCEPILAAPRIDWAVNAALLLSYVCLRLGDRVSFFGFDARPHLTMGLMSGTGAFAHLQSLAARLDYSNEETNFTLGFATLQERLRRRSMIVVFTDFADSTSAELMIENLTRLARRHVILFVAFQDEELERLRDAEPRSADDVCEAVIADRLLRERSIVLARLRRLGAHIISPPADRIGPALVRAYDELRRKERL